MENDNINFDKIITKWSRFTKNVLQKYCLMLNLLKQNIIKNNHQNECRINIGHITTWRFMFWIHYLLKMLCRLSIVEQDFKLTFTLFVQ
jgi:hypothetical protein